MVQSYTTYLYKKRFLFLLATSLVLGILFIASLLQKQSLVTRGKEPIVIFIHGTNSAVLSILDVWNPVFAWNTVRRAMEQGGKRVHHGKYSLTKTVAKKIRESTYMKGSGGTMLDEGLVHLPRELFERYKQEQLTPEEKKLSAIHIIHAYDTVAKLFSSQRNDYYTFGWVGVLDKKIRRAASETLYSSLVQFEGHPITLITHSYGGAIALYLAEIEAREQKNVKIENLIMLAPPIEKETASLATHELFKNIYNFYSEGDGMQIGDKFTTEQGKLTRTLFAQFEEHSLAKTREGIVRDIRLFYNNKPSFDHISMWSVSCSPRGIRCLHPFPLIILLPALIDLLNKVQSRDLLCDLLIEDYFNAIKAKLTTFNSDDILFSTKDLMSTIDWLKEITTRNWDPTYNFFVTTKIGKVIPGLAKKPGL